MRKNSCHTGIARLPRSLFVLQGGGPTAVINATLAGIAEQASGHFDQLLGFRHSFEQAGTASLIDLSGLLQTADSGIRLRSLANTPGAVLGSSRNKACESDLLSIVTTMQQHRATDLIGIGGNGTMAVLDMLATFAETQGLPLNIVGAPKTVDNDLAGVHAAPGYGSAAKFVALAVRDFDCDFRAMHTFDDVTVLETMGRHSGWLAAASILFKNDEHDAPHIVLLPEQSFDQEPFLDEVVRCHKHYGRVFIVTNEMLSDADGNTVGAEVQNGPRDALGRSMYSLSSGTGNYLADLIWTKLNLQARCLRPGSLGRAMSFCQSDIDRQLALDCGRYAARIAFAEQSHRHMVSIDEQLQLSRKPLSEVIGERPMPARFLGADAIFGIDASFRDFIRPLVGNIDPLFDSSTLPTID